MNRKPDQENVFQKQDLSNFERMREEARAIFVKTDPEIIRSRLPIEWDEDFYYINYLGEKFKVSVRDGDCLHMDGSRALPYEAVILYDVLAHGVNKPFLTGRWTLLVNLKGTIASGHAQTLTHYQENQEFEGKAEELKNACIHLGGKKADHGDVSYVIPVFDFFPFWLQFWDGDEEFPASMTFKWDQNSLDYFYYETLEYMTRDIKNKLVRMLDKSER